MEPKARSAPIISLIFIKDRLLVLYRSRGYLISQRVINTVWCQSCAFFNGNRRLLFSDAARVGIKAIPARSPGSCFKME